MQRFLEWLEQRGVPVLGCGVAPMSFDGGGWGMQATKNFQPESILFRIPDSVLITSETVMASKIGIFFKKNSGVFKPFEALTIWLCCEYLSGEHSKWFPYLQILPQTVTNPVNYEDFPVECLPPSVKPLLSAHKLEFARFFAKLTAVSAEVLALDPIWVQKLEIERANYSLWDLLSWSWCMVNTRCIFKPGWTVDQLDNSDGDSLALAPFVDLLNHSSNTQVEAMYSRTRCCYELISHATVSAGNQLFVSYGPHSNAKLFVEYGFVLGENVNNSLQLTTDEIVRLARKASFLVSEKKEEILQNAAFPCFLYDASDEPSWGLMAAYKVITMTEDQLKRWQELVYNRVDFSDDVALIKCVKSVLSVFYAELEENLTVVRLDEVPESLRLMVNQLWKDELGIVRQAIDQLSELEAEGSCDSDSFST